MKRIACAAFMLITAFVANGQCSEKIQVDRCQDTILHKTDYHELLSRDSTLQKENETLKQANSILQKRLDNLKVDEFLNIQDTSIFGNRFLNIDGDLLSKRNRDFYELIRLIHDLNYVLNQKGEGTYSELLKMAKENSEKASGIIDTIITTVREDVFSYLSASQDAYYRQLIQQYNELIESMK